MTVYEMIQELSKYDADMEVEINVVADDFKTDATANDDCKDGEKVSVNVTIDETIEDFDIDEYKKVRITVGVD